MKKNKNESWPGFQIGTSYLLVIFIVMCLVTFAVLSLSSALKDQSYTKKVADHQTAYASASAAASARLADIDTALQSETPYNQLQDIDDITITTKDSNWLISYSVPMTESQNLEVSVLVNPSDGSRRVICWKETASSQWTQKTTLPVLGSKTNND